MYIVNTGLSLMAAALLATCTTLAQAQTCNPNIPLTKPDSRYTYNTAGDEVTDTVTGLIWKRCAEGMSWSGLTCTGTYTRFTWEGALAQAATQSGGWRLPNIKELESLVEAACNGMAINQGAFPSTPFNAWSVSPYASEVSSVWVITFGNGECHFHSKYLDYSVRLVRGQ